MKVQFTAKAASGKTKAKSALVVTVNDSLKLGSQASAINKKAKSAITRAISASKFKGKKGEIFSIPGLEVAPADRVVVVGLGKESDIDNNALHEVGGAIVAHLNAAGVKTAQVVLDLIKKQDIANVAAQLALSGRLRNYFFDKYYTKRKEEVKPTLTSLSFVLKEDKAAKKLYADLEKVAAGVELTRDVVTEPANIIYPETFAAECKKLSALGVKVEVLSEAQMKKLGMGALLGVGQGSTRPSKMVIMQWDGGKKSEKPVAFVGKGVTFDTGGISIKPSANMGDMKYDMGGAGVVIGLMKALSGRKAKVNAIGVVGLVENMPDGNAQRPGDVVTSMSGQTIEILNTDAEGRLVLADALWYTQSKYKPKFMVNLATLTGAILVALGDSCAGLFSNNDKLSKQLEDASAKTNELIWRFPLADRYDKMIDSDIADMKNIGDGRGAGSITAAQFLQRFVNDTPWAHLDIAGVTWSGKGIPTATKGATGFGVRLLDQLVRDHYEG
ncbi:MAG: leucyl aminopeptidase [Rickettsiales bacterium]|nr:leucyl aminopeptidase [Rickettsiales bacterium]